MSEIKNIPSKYQPDFQQKRQDQARKQDQAGAGEMETPDDNGYIYGPDINMKLTKAGLVFSGPTAFVSNMHRCDFVYNGQPYTSSEQGIQHLNAVHHKVPELAQKILDTSSPKEIKSISHDIPKSESWPKISPGILWDLNEAKFTQNSPLLQKLIETAPHKLIEATVDSHWGGGGGGGEG